MVSKELSDQELISNPRRFDMRAAWIYFYVIALTVAVHVGGVGPVFSRQHRLQKENPFLQVTNRDFSLFLYQFPEYMRVNVSGKAGYLPGFQYSEKIGIEPGQADDYVSAPPEVLSLYHIWKGLVGDVLIPREIKEGEFRYFLEYSPEWAGWDPKSVEVQKAFIGWKNYFMEGELINKVSPTYREMGEFLAKYPQYGRNYWQNLLVRGRPDYLKSLFSGVYDPDAKVPENEMAAFLKVAYYNFSQK